MMRYIDSVVQPGETVRQVATIHWIVYLPGLAVLFVTTIIYLMVPKNGMMQTIGSWLALCLLAGSVYLLIRAWLRQFSTEYAVTDRRVIYKRGLVWRKTMEMNMDKISSVDVEQSIFGRMLNYGTVRVYSPGADPEPIKDIGSPIDFRTHIIAK
jgi:uncharacterized membrane protein YdbT with pleckstrin-like domain